MFDPITITGVSFENYTAAIKNGNQQHLKIEFRNQDVVLTESNLYIDGFKREFILNGDADLHIGAAVSSQITLILANDSGDLSGIDFTDTFDMYMGVEINNSVKYVPYGVFKGIRPAKVMEDTIELVAYDQMKNLDADASEYLASINYSTTLANIFDGMMTWLDLDGDRTGANQNISNVIYSAPFDGVGVTFRDLLGWIAEATGCYAMFSREGECVLVKFEDHKSDYILTANDYYTIEKAEYTIPAVDRVSVKVTRLDVGANYPVSGSFENEYVILDNPYLYGTDATALGTYAQRIYNTVHAFGSYVPCTVDADGNWLLDPGDIIGLKDINDNSVSGGLPIFSMTDVWNGRMETIYESYGTEQRNDRTISERQLTRNYSMFHELEVTIEGLRSEIVTQNHHIYVQMTDPIDSGIEPLVGDFWVKSFGGDQWQIVKQYTWGIIKTFNWSMITDGNITYCWSGVEWTVVADTTIIAEQNTKIEQTAQAIITEANRANAAEGELSARIQQTADAIQTEVTNRQNGDSSTLSSAKTYAEEVASTAESNAKNASIQKTSTYQSATAIVTAAETYANGVASTAESNAKNASIAKTSELQTAEQIVNSAKSYTNGKLTDYSTTSQTAQSISSEVKKGLNGQGGYTSSVYQTANQVTAKIEDLAYKKQSLIDIASNAIRILSGGTLDVNSNNFVISSENRKMQSGNWTFDDNGILFYLDSTHYFRMYIGDTTPPTVVFDSINCPMRYGSDFNQPVEIVGNSVIINATSSGSVEIRKGDIGYSYNDVCLICGEADNSSGDYTGSKGNIGISEKRWDNAWFRVVHYQTKGSDSSKFLKHNICDMEDKSDVIDMLRPVTFIYNDDKSEKVRNGLIYEEVESLVPEMCVNDNGVKALDYDGLVPVLLKEIQSLRRRVINLERMVK